LGRNPWDSKSVPFNSDNSPVLIMNLIMRKYLRIATSNSKILLNQFVVFSKRMSLSLKVKIKII
jgi:hypothetical protein